MSSALTATRTATSSPRFLARLAGVLYAIAVLTAVCNEFISPGAMGRWAFVVATGCYAAVMLLLYAILKSAHRSLALLATLVGLAGFAADALHWRPYSISADIPLHGLFCILIGWLFLRSRLLPGALAMLMALAGVVWLLYLYPPLVQRLAPSNSMAGLLGEAIPMLWLLFMGLATPQNERLSRATEVLP